LRTDEDMVPLIQLAKTVPLFRQLSLDLVKRLCRSMRYLFMPKHTTICKEGDMGTLFYIILSGKVRGVPSLLLLLLFSVLAS